MFRLCRVGCIRTFLIGPEEIPHSAEDLAKLHEIKTIFVEGNNESATKIRKHLESSTCFQMVNNKSKADAVMSVSEENKPDEGMHWVVTSITLTTPDGDQIWTQSKGGGGFINSGSGMADDKLLKDLRKDACSGRSESVHRFTCHVSPPARIGPRSIPPQTSPEVGSSQHGAASLKEEGFESSVRLHHRLALKTR
jgi:hypothetical protein